MKMLKKTIYVVLHLAIISTLLFSLMIYTSLIDSFPWYESCGTQFLAIFIISAPLLLCEGILLKLLNYKYLIKKDNILFPFYSLIGISAPILIDGSLGALTLLVGITICILCIIKTIAFAIDHFKYCKDMNND